MRPRSGLRPRVLVTGIGGPAAQGFVGAFEPGDVEWFVADTDPLMPGFQLFAPDRRMVLPRGDAPDFVDAVREACLTACIDIVVPTVDSELLPLARATAEFEAQGTHVLVARPLTLVRCLDKAALAVTLRSEVRVPATSVLRDDGELSTFTGPVVTKPRKGSGSRGVLIHESAAAIGTDVPRDGSHVVQEYLPGPEYSIDVLADRSGAIVASVPRERSRVDSGIAIAARTVNDPGLQEFGARVARTIGLRGVANVQARLDRHGEVALLEVNPRFPGTMALTVASGVNMPRLALEELLGTPMPPRTSFRETVLVRTWADHVVDPAMFGRGLEPVRGCLA